ncbi:LOW QUALITY PROTEIN: hypothetical protein PHMEG_0009977 [Phytophthora megakarya]|uniref:Integrase catalytic domain-containing protein n=1 Tax=Phytophthora megakarya TaxID=4795 RepID=A0A225WFE9_9STRA|nr:LOW QUALITY PROTEIN: hypothetical protein PHMEG_0009977 [Phytophthora megakarya]
MLKASLHEFHVRFGHLNYADVERMARHPANGIDLTDKMRKNCVNCAEGTNCITKERLSDECTNRCGRRCNFSDLKGPITPMDRHKNRYMINFIGHKSTFCRIFVARTKAKAADKFKYFMVYFERVFNVRVHVLRTDGGGEYKLLDVFCAQTGIAWQMTEPRTSASNGKAERLHHTIMNMVRCMLFGGGLPLNYWG